MSHNKPKLTRNEQMIVALQQQINAISIGCLSEIRGLMVALKVDPKLFVESVNNDEELKRMSRNIESFAGLLKAKKEKEKANLEQLKPILQTDD